MKQYIKTHINQCFECLFNRTRGGKQQGKLNPIPPGDKPFQVVHLDHLGPFVKSSKRNTELLVAICNFTKFVRLRAYPSTATKHVIRFLEELCNDFGAPARLITDRGSCFTAKAFTDFCAARGISYTLISAQRPKGNGQVERINRELLPAIRISSESPSGADWDVHLMDIQRNINSAPSKSTGR